MAFMMTRKFVFLVGTWNLPQREIEIGVNALSQSWGGRLFQYRCEQNPTKILNSLPAENGLAHLVGDAAMTQHYGFSWLEALGAWKQPTVLLASPLPVESLSGMAAAYVALCEVQSVPLIGIVQLGNPWDASLRRLDGLPWCGCIRVEDHKSSKSNKFAFTASDLDAQQVVRQLNRRMNYLLHN